MDIGSEIGTKMRSAVKAKLVELGTGDNAGYIDDELPDYIMIMIANKRSKQQMVSDLELFLGSKTIHFVHWLYEVLQKLQEVTIPAAIAKPAGGKKTKIIENKKGENKKEKRVKDNKKDKGKTNKPLVSNATLKTSEYNSINDVVAEHLLEKAKKELDITSLHETNVKKAKETKNNTNNTPIVGKSNNMPATSEITSSTDVSGSVERNDSNVVISGNRDKDLAELAEIQRRIYAAKKHLKEIGELDEQFESEDEDFLNLKDDDSTQDFDLGDDLLRKSLSKHTSVEESNDGGSKKLNPNLLDNNTITGSEKNIPSLQQHANVSHETTNNNLYTEKEISKEPIIGAERDTDRSPQSKHGNESTDQQKNTQVPADEVLKKRPVHERLGTRKLPTNEEEETARSRRPRIEKKLYVPTFRRLEKETEHRGRKAERGRERIRETERSRERSRERERSRGERERERERDARQRHASQSQATYSRHLSDTNRRRSSSADSRDSNDRDAQRQRIGSRVIVAANKPAPPSESDEEKPVNSVIKIKPRAPVSPSKQASKNLLMRAMAEAQRSTILSKNTKKDIKSNRVKERLGDKPLRERLKRSANSTSRTNTAGMALFRRTTQNLIIEVDAAEKSRQKRRRYSNDISPEEYVPTPISEHSESDGDHMYGPKIYKPRNVNEYTIKSK